ncbi:MAG TPA: ABC transporter permease [Chloroflexota bacterium]|jgi:peptide/nickel transport system permease protein
MGVALGQAAPPIDVPSENQWSGQARGGLRYLARNRQLILGLVMLGALALFVIFGNLFYDVSKYRPLSVVPGRPPAAEYPLGTDSQGRDMLAVMIVGTPLTLRMGLLAGFLGVALGTVLAFAGAYYGGVLDALVRGVVDVGLTIPTFLVLIIVAISIHSAMTVDQMALVIAALAWLWPTRTIRAQVLTMRERSYVHVARLSGSSNLKIIFVELMPNLLPYLAASLVAAVAAAILASLGLEALGLGAVDSPTIGMTIYWVIFYGALLQGMWWWFLPPIIVVVLLFMGLFGLSAGLDEWANPRLRKAG